MSERIMNTDDVSTMTSIPSATLRFYRHRGVGPRWFRLGPRKVAYKASDVQAWLDEQYDRTQSVA